MTAPPLAAIALALAACSLPSGPPSTGPDGGVSPPPYRPPEGHLCSGNWCWESPYPQGSGLAAIWVFGKDDVWAAGQGATVIHWNGSEWSYRGPVEPSASEAAFTGLWGSGPDDLWLWGPSGVYRWDGTSWSAAEPPGAAQVRSIFGSGPSSVWAVGQGGLVAHWDGSAWSATSAGRDTLTSVWSNGEEVWALGAVPGAHLEDLDTALWHHDGAKWTSDTRDEELWGLWGADGNSVYAYGNAGMLRWDGNGWRALSPSIQPGAMWGSSATDVWAFDATSRRALHYDGNDWAQADLPEHWIAWDATGTAPGDVWVSGAHGRIANWDGSRWSPVAGAPLEADLKLPGGALWAADGEELWAAGKAGGLVRWDGSSWSKMEDAGHYAALWGSQDGSGWAAGSYSRLAHRSGGTWKVSAGGDPLHFHGVWAASPEDAWAVGDAIYHHDGESWTLVRDLSEQAVALRAVWGHSESDVWAVGDEGTILHWGGDDWTVQTSGTTDPLAAIWGFSDRDVWAAGSRYEGGAFELVILHWDGERWKRRESPGAGVAQALWGPSPEALWLSVRSAGSQGGSEGRLLRWDGEGWTEEKLPDRHDPTSLWGWSRDHLAVTSRGGLLRYRP